MRNYEIASINRTAEFLEKFPNLTDSVSSGVVSVVDLEVALVAYETRPLSSTLLLHAIHRTTAEGEEVDDTYADEFIIQEAKTWGLRYIAIVGTLYDTSTNP